MDEEEESVTVDNWHLTKMNRQRSVFIAIFAALSVLLIILPLLVSFNDFLTKIVEANILYKWIQANIVPIEAKMMGALLIPFGHQFAFSPSNATIVVNGINMGITWNCIGWQSFLLLIVTFLVGLRGKYTGFSTGQAIAIGILGTFWLNILRMLLIVLLAVHLPAVFRIVFHDYLAAVTTIIWLFVFWWFTYAYVLEEKSI